MLKFIPLSINKQAVRPTKNGITFFMVCLASKPIALPNTMILNMSGIVPNPKANMSAELCNTLPVAAAVPIAKYTSPQGNKPFIIPIK